MAHETYHIGNLKDTLLGQFKHDRQGVGQYGHARCSRAATSLFFKEQVRGMIGADHVYASACEFTAQGVAVSLCLDGGVAFYERTFGAVILVGEPQMCGAGLGGELLALNRTGLEQLQLTGCCEMQYMQMHVCAGSHVKSLGGRCVTGLLAAYERMILHRGLTAALGGVTLHVGVYD